MKDKGPERYRELCSYLGEPYRNAEGFGLWGALRQREKEFMGWDQDVITGLIIRRAGIWNDAGSIIDVVNKLAPSYDRAPLTFRELHRARLGESTLGRVHLRGEAWSGSRPRLYARDAHQGPSGLYILTELKLPTAGRVGAALARCGCPACAPDADQPGVWRLSDIFDPDGARLDYWRADFGGYTPVKLEDPCDSAIVEGAVYLWAEELED